MLLGEFVKFIGHGKVQWGEKQGDIIAALEQAPWNGLVETGQHFNFNDVEILPPAEATKIVCVGLNYRDHAREMGKELPHEPLLFLKPPSALLSAGKSIVRPHASQRVDYEAELAIVVGKKLSAGDDDPAAIFGFTCANDVTARDLQKTDGQWTRAKGFDTFCPLGPSLITGIDPTSAAIQCRVNGELKQDSNTKNMIFSPDQLVHFIAGIMTLNPGDVILTGTPGGIGPLVAGDEVEVSIDGVGRLQNLVIDASE